MALFALEPGKASFPERLRPLRTRENLAEREGFEPFCASKLSRSIRADLVDG
jgi:hypothetical protein